MRCAGVPGMVSPDTLIRARIGLRCTSFPSARINFMQNQLVYVQVFWKYAKSKGFAPIGRFCGVV